MTKADVPSTPAPRGRRVALITGGTRGLGLGVARALTREGWDLALCGLRSPDEVRAVTEELGGHGTEVAYWAADVANADDRCRLLEQIVKRFGQLNALVNNAGRAPRVRADLLDATESSFEDILRTNLQGPYFLTQAVANRLVEQRKVDPRSAAVVVFVTSVSADMASPNRGEYCVSKAGLSMAARLFALRLAGDGIPVYEVRPGIMATDMTAPVQATYGERIAQGLVPERRWGTPEDVGSVVAALLRGDLPYATGSVLHVDGGMSLPRL